MAAKTEDELHISFIGTLEKQQFSCVGKNLSPIATELSVSLPFIPSVILYVDVLIQEIQKIISYNGKVKIYNTCLYAIILLKYHWNHTGLILVT